MNETIEDLDRSETKVVLVVPKEHVKSVKTSLDQSGTRDRNTPISLEIDHSSHANIVEKTEYLESNGGVPPSDSKVQFMRLPTTFPYSFSETDEALPNKQKIQNLKTTIINHLNLHTLAPQISLSHHTTPLLPPRPKPKNPLQKALKQALDNLPNQILSTLNLTSETLTSAFPESYSIYPPLLLLPAKTFTSAPWQTFLNRHPIPSQPTQAILEYVAAALGTTHVASNAPIPLDTAHMQQANVFRSPVNIAALYRSLGPPPTRQTRAAPSQQDFAAALWVSARQNGINQTWAPAYTMFSRGNVSEKARLLHLPTVTQMRGSAAALDMYAGIGYFAFSYVKAGVRPVVCFEVNGWSVEGMRRGAEMNGWKCRIYTDVVGAEDVDGDADLLVFWMANERVEEVLGKIGGSVGPIRHVNLGLLPRSRGAWGAATRVIEGAGRGWIHAHENVGVDEIRDRTTEVEGEFQRLLEGRGEMKATVEHVESVKLYAPGVMHCVFDVCIDKNRE